MIMMLILMKDLLMVIQKVTHSDFRTLMAINSVTLMGSRMVIQKAIRLHLG